MAHAPDHARTRRWFLTAAASLLLAGCSRSGDALVPVSGHVVVDGKPAAGAAVVFHPADSAANGTHPVGRVDEHGDFQLTTIRSGDGAAPGDYRVTLTWYVSSPGKRVVEGEESPVRNLIPDTYARAESTPLTATVRADGTDPVRIEIRTKRR